MAIAEQFAGLQMDQLIGAPLRAAADASTLLANSTADFINRVGFDAGGKVRTVAFAYQKRSMNEDGSSNLDEMKVDIPMLAIVPIPNLQVDEVNVLFDMEVRQSEKEESSMDMGASITGTVNLGIVKVSVTGSISAHSANTRSSDNSAKYHVDVRATNHGTPEGLARVLDMMAANVAPSLVGTTLKDGNGQNLSEQAKIKAERLKTLRHEVSQIENRLNAAKDSLDNQIAQLKRLAGTQQNEYQGKVLKLMGTLKKDDPVDDEKALAYSQVMDGVNQSWNTFKNQTADLIKLIVDSKEPVTGVSTMLALKSLDKNGDISDYVTTETYYNAIAAAQKNAMEARAMVDEMEKELFVKKSEYSDAVAGKVTPAIPSQPSKPAPAPKS